MNTIKNISLTASEIKKLVKSQYRAQIFQGIDARPVAITGHTGLGKTEVIIQAAQELTNELTEEAKDHKNEGPVWDDIRNRIQNGTFIVQAYSINLAVLEAPDFQGQPSQELDSEGRTVYGRPITFPDYNDYAILFLDETNRANVDIRNSLLQLISLKAINRHKLGPYTMLAGAMNPANHDSGATYEVDDLDEALTTRLFHADFKFVLDELTNHLTSKYGHHSVIQWIRNQPDVVDVNGESRCNPRAIEGLIKRLSITGKDPGEDFHSLSADEVTWMYKLASGEIGMHSATAYKTFLQSLRVLRYTDILNKYNETEWLPPLVRDIVKQGRMDELNNAINNICKEIKSEKDKNPYNKIEDVIPKKWLDNIHAFLMDTPDDLVPAFFISLNDAVTAPSGDGNDFYRHCAREIIKKDEIPGNKVHAAIKRHHDTKKAIREEEYNKALAEYNKQQSK